MINVTYHMPSPRIASYVGGIFILEQNGESPLRLPLFANGTPTLVFHTTQEPYNNSRLTLYGQTIAPGELFLGTRSTLIAYFLQPWCLPALFKLAADELTDHPIDLSLISKDHDLRDMLVNAKSAKHMLSLFDDYVTRLALQSSQEDHRIKYAASQIVSIPQKDILTRIQQDLYVTERSFQRMFKKHIGVSPNQFRRIIQFNNAFRQLNERKFNNLSDLAFDNGYADQSHFNRTFREFTNQTATQYLDICPFT